MGIRCRPKISWQPYWAMRLVVFHIWAPSMHLLVKWPLQLTADLTGTFSRWYHFISLDLNLNPYNRAIPARPHLIPPRPASPPRPQQSNSDRSSILTQIGISQCAICSIKLGDAARKWNEEKRSVSAIQEAPQAILPSSISVVFCSIWDSLGFSNLVWLDYQLQPHFGG